MCVLKNSFIRNELHVLECLLIWLSRHSARAGGARKGRPDLRSETRKLCAVGISPRIWHRYDFPIICSEIAVSGGQSTDNLQVRPCPVYPPTLTWMKRQSIFQPPKSLW